MDELLVLSEVKCGYCGEVILSVGFQQHRCFAHFNPDTNNWNLTDNGVMTIIGNGEEACESSEPQYIHIDELDELIIGIVKDKPPLWNYRLDIKQRHREQMRCTWEEVSNCLNNLCSAEVAEKRWTSLLKSYRTARSQYLANLDKVTRSGAGSEAKENLRRPSFKHYDAMEFLNDTLEHRTTISYTRFEKPSKTSTPSSSTIESLENENIAPTNIFVASSSPYSEIQLHEDINHSTPSANNPVRPPTSCAYNPANTPASSIRQPTPSPSSLVRPPTPSPSNFIRPLITPSPDINVSNPSRRSRSRSNNSIDLKREIINALNTPTTVNPIDGFLLSCAEGMQQLSYNRRKMLEIKILTLIHEEVQAESREREEGPL